VTDPNDKLLDEYLRRESVVSQRYREIEADMVPPELDAAVLAQARAATVTQRKLKPGWMKWSAPLALAASAVLIVAIVLEVGIQEDVRMPAATMEPTTSSQPSAEAQVVQEVVQIAPIAAPSPQMQFEPASPAADQATSERKAEAPAELAKKSTEREAIESVVVTERKRQETLQDAPMSVGAMSRDELDAAATDLGTARSDSNSAGAVSESLEQARAAANEQVVVTAQSHAESRPRSAPIPPRAVNIMRSPPAPAPPAQQAPRLAPGAWLEQIRALRREGKVLEADEQWKEFSDAYPNFEVAEADAARPRP
jgi:cytoskeletal protein RodZ